MTEAPCTRPRSGFEECDWFEESSDMKSLGTVTVVIGIAGVIAAGIYVSGGGSTASGIATPMDAIADPKMLDDLRKPPSEGPDVATTGPWPKAVAEEIEFNFGRAQVLKEMKHTFAIRNDGPVDLILEAGQPTCQCTTFTLDRTTVPPGEHAELLIEWQGKSADTSFSHGGPVLTNDPDNRAIRFRVHGIVDDPFVMRPQGTWNAGEISGHEPVTMHGSIYSTVLDTLDIESLTCDSPHVTLTAEPASPQELLTIDAISGFNLRITLSPEIAPGPFEDSIHVKIAQIKDPISIPLKAHKPGSIRILPTYGVVWKPETHGLVLGRFSATEGRTAKLLLLVDESKMDEPFQLTEVHADPSFIEVSVTPESISAGAMTRYSLTITVPPGIPRTSRDADDPATIRCRTNHPSGEELLLRVKMRSF